MDDLISRQAAIAEIMEDIKDRSLHDDPGTPEDYAEGYDEGIRNAAVIVLQMPSAQPGWIPIGAPMNSGQHYLVTLRQKFEGEETYRVRIMRLHEGHWLYPHHFPEWINDEMEQEVVAWMPLPAPYIPEGDDKHEG